MSLLDGQDAGDPRARAAHTKRTRTRGALLSAAEAAFEARGWARTRVEDIAAAAGVSAATAYNHFPSKHGLIGTVYSSYVRVLAGQADRALAEGRDVVEALAEQVFGLARMTARHHGLSAAFTAAVQDYTIRVGAAPDREDLSDPRVLAPVPDVLVGLVERGQATGVLRAYPGAYEISTTLVNLLLLRLLSRRDEPPEHAAELMLTVLFGALRPELLVDAGPDGRPFRQRLGRMAR